MMKDSFQVKSADFEGPLDLLLTLIEKRKFFINDISLARVADDYLNYIKDREHLPVKDTAHFILVASTLVLIKSKSLLPALILTEEEKGDIKDLESRLKQYRRIRDLGERHVKSAFGAHILFAKSPSKHRDPIFLPDIRTTAADLLHSAKKVIESLPKKEIVPETVVKKIVSLEKMMDNLTRRMQKSLKMSFNNFSQMGQKDKAHIVVSFLAMLELVKQGIIDVVQVNNFGDIDMESMDIGVPKYD